MPDDTASEDGVPGHANLPIGCVGDHARWEGERAGEANREIGVPRGGPGGVPGGEGDGEGEWRSRGYMPHCDKPGKIQHVTFHLADSLPRHVLEVMEDEVKGLPTEKQDVERRKRMESWLDAGLGSCVLRIPEIGRKVQESLLFLDGQRYRMIAWVVMPNHVHTLFEPIENWEINKIVASWKKFTARLILEYRRAHPEHIGSGCVSPRQASPGHANLPIGCFKHANREIGVPREKNCLGVYPPAGPVWHEEFWDRFIRDERHFERAFEYIHANPVNAGLVKMAEDWPWSGARLRK